MSIANPPESPMSDGARKNGYVGGRATRLILGLFPLFVGGLIYILFRTSSLKMFRWYEILGLDHSMGILRYSSIPFAHRLPKWIIYSLPDGLWIFSYLTLMLIIWRNVISRNNIFWILIVPAIAIISELGQLIGIVPGTFDPADILFYLLGTSLPFIILNQTLRFNLRASC